MTDRHRYNVRISVVLGMCSLLSIRPAVCEERPHFDLYIMALCPYGGDAVLQLLEAKRSAPDEFSFKIHYIVHERGIPDAQESPALPGVLGSDGSVDKSVPGAEDRFYSLHGPEEIEETKRQLVIERFFPDLLAAYLFLRYTGFPNTDRRKIVADLGISETELTDLLKESSDNLLSDRLASAGVKNVRVSPTLFVDGRRLAGPITVDRILRILCADNNFEASYCSGVPVCADDYDCRQEGMIGVCENPDTGEAECRYFPIEKTELTFTPGSDPEIMDASPVFAFLREFIPGLSVVEEPDEKDLPFLPYYRFEKEIEKAPRFGSLKRFLVERKDHFVLDPERLSVVYLPTRESIPGRIDFVYRNDSWEGAPILKWIRRNLRVEDLHLRTADDPKDGRSEDLALVPKEDGTWELRSSNDLKARKEDAEWIREVGLASGEFALMVDNRIWIRDFDAGVQAWLKKRFPSNNQ